MRRGPDGEVRTRWMAALMRGVGEAALRRWKSKASAEARTRQSVLSNARWMVQEPPRGRAYPRAAWLVAVRLWCGLPVGPAIPAEGVVLPTECQNRYAAEGQTMGRGHGVRGRKCHTKVNGQLRPTQLDGKGRHAITCKVGGIAVMRHNMVRDYLGFAMRSLVAGVAWEKAVPDFLTDQEARLDLVVSDVAHSAVLDIVVFHPIQPNGTRVYHHQRHEDGKYAKYPQSKDGRRSCTRPLVPVVVSTFGQLNAVASEYFAVVEETARVKGKPFVAELAGPQSLAQLVSLVAILEVANIVLDAHSQCCGAGGGAGQAQGGLAAGA